MHLVPLLLYAAATATYMAHFAWRDARVGRLATAMRKATQPPEMAAVAVCTAWRKRMGSAMKAMGSIVEPVPVT